ncbi:MAG TPA: helix-turn-helix transcriptional regulator [Pseudonocardiaceae bacterium]|jgi:transcriptional regulator with XRE-family HTH domain|nr:helix-turn-helix transcriptional regulator [Pseudonocardiaceae bacterium]
MGNSSVRTREFGARIRILREGLGLPGYKLAADLELVGSTISRLESGSKNAIGVTALNSLLTVCGLRGNALKEYLTRWSTEDNGYFVAPHGDQLPDNLLALMIHDDVATSIADYELSYIPGLLQTENYIRALFPALGVAEKHIDAGVRTRLGRQQLVNRNNAPDLSFFIHENALRTPFGEDQVMHEQMVSLLMASAQPNISIRILPLSTRQLCSHASFRLMKFDTIEPVGYTEGLGASMFVERPSDIDRYRSVLNHLDVAALDEAQSATMLHSMEKLYG